MDPPAPGRTRENREAECVGWVRTPATIQNIMQIPFPDEIPTWAQTLVGVLVGGAGVRFLQVMLENRRLNKREYRETLISRITELEGVVATLYRRIENLASENSSLRAELRHLEDDGKL